MFAEGANTHEKQVELQMSQLASNQEVVWLSFLLQFKHSLIYLVLGSVSVNLNLEEWGWGASYPESTDLISQRIPQHSGILRVT